MKWLLLVNALLLSGIAAWYSVTGLVAIFAAAAIPIIIMGGALEVSKLVVASYLHQHWSTMNKWLRTYLMAAVFILMVITSMGIFGFLSKAHLDQAVPAGDVQASLNLIDEKIKNEKDIIADARKTLSQLDAQVDQVLGRSADEAGASKSVQIRNRQSRERRELLANIEAAQKRIAPLNEERAKIASEVRAIEAEVGPVKYVAALIYGDDTQDHTTLEKAIRWVIILLVVVFDPLAIALLLAWNSLNSTKPQEQQPTITITIDSDTEPPPAPLPQEPPPIDSESVTLTPEATIEEPPVVEAVMEAIPYEPPTAPRVEVAIYEVNKGVTELPELRLDGTSFHGDRHLRPFIRPKQQTELPPE